MSGTVASISNSSAFQVLDMDDYRIVDSNSTSSSTYEGDHFYYENKKNESILSFEIYRIFNNVLLDNNLVGTLRENVYFVINRFQKAFEFLSSKYDIQTLFPRFSLHINEDGAAQLVAATQYMRIGLTVEKSFDKSSWFFVSGDELANICQYDKLTAQNIDNTLCRIIAYAVQNS